MPAYLECASGGDSVLCCLWHRSAFFLQFVVSAKVSVIVNCIVRGLPTEVPVVVHMARMLRIS